MFRAILDILQTSYGQLSTLPFQGDLSRSCLSLSFAILKEDVQRNNLLVHHFELESLVQWMK